MEILGRELGQIIVSDISCYCVGRASVRRENLDYLRYADAQATNIHNAVSTFCHGHLLEIY